MSKGTELYLMKALSLEALDFEGISSRLVKPTTMRLLHGVLGLSSEVGELLKAVMDNDKPNILEETGDAFWYGGVCADVLSILMPSLNRTEMFQYSTKINATPQVIGKTATMITMVEDLEYVQSQLKAHIYYGRDISYDEVFMSVCCIMHRCASIGLAFGWTQQDIMDANLRKLMSSDRARYKDGFSEDDANNRDTEAERSVLEGIVGELGNDIE